MLIVISPVSAPGGRFFPPGNTEPLGGGYKQKEAGGFFFRGEKSLLEILDHQDVAAAIIQLAVNYPAAVR